MCLGIPGQIVELLAGDEQLARVEVTGVRRTINVGLLEDEGIAVGDWVLIHVGFAMSKIDEEEAATALSSLRMMGQGYDDELAALLASRVEAAGATATRRSDEVRRRVPRPGGRPRRWWPASPSWPATTPSSSWRCAAATPTPSTATASSTCCPRASSWCTARAARCASSRWAGSTTPSPWPRRPGVIFTSFGDMMRVPGGHGNLLEAKARGADVRFVYSPLDALRIAVEHPDRRGGVLRRRVRDHGSVDGGDAAQGAGRRRPQLQRVQQPRHDRPADQGDPRVARPAPRRLPRPGPRVDGRSATARTGSCPSSTASRS